MKVRSVLSVFSFLFVLFYYAQPKLTEVTWTQQVKKVSDCEFDLIFDAKIDHPWHMYSLKKAEGEDGPNPTKFTFTKSSEYELVGKMKESKPIEEFDKVFEMKVFYFENKATFTQRIKVKTNKKFKVNGLYEFQICTESQCKFSPMDTKFSFDIPETAACEATAITGTVVPTATVVPTPAACICDTAEILKIKSAVPTVKTATPDNKKTEIKPGTEKKNEEEKDCSPWENFFLGLGAGFGAMIMPCIYSMIPLTVSFFLKRNKTRAAAIKDSMLYGFFIVISFVIPTMLITIIFGDTALSNIATNTYVNLFFFVLFIIFALSFFGLFEITLPASWANKLDSNADRGGILGLFFMALTLVVVSFSCTAGFIGPLLSTLAAGKNYLCPLVGFTGFGLGIALPFMLFAFFPSMLKSLPKSGGWMTTFKVTVAFIELALAVKFLTNADNVNEWGIMTREVFITVWIAIFAMLTFYLLGMFRTSHDDPPSHLSVGRIMWATFFLAFTIYMIPGLWGAPLKIISAFPPPHYYAEAPNGFHSSAQSSAVSDTTVKKNTNSDSETASLEALRIPGPDGLQLFKDDYESALKYSRLVKKPLFLDFTGKACANCRWMESHVWVKPEVFSLLRDSFVIVSLYVDSRKDLPDGERKTVDWNGEQVDIKTYGQKFGFIQSTRFKASAQPMYAVVNNNDEIISDGTKETERDAEKYAAWLRSALTNYRKK